MIPEFVARFEKNKEKIRAKFSKKRPKEYKDIVKAVVEALEDKKDYDGICSKKIRYCIDGDYQGTLLFIIKGSGYRPHNYWYVKIAYGSCSGCDTLKYIRDSDRNKKEKLDDYMTLALHVVQGLKDMSNEEERVI